MQNTLTQLATHNQARAQGFLLKDLIGDKGHRISQAAHV